MAKKELTEEEKVHMADYRKRSERKSVKFKNIQGSSGEPAIALRDPDDPLRSVKIFEALGTAGDDLQSHLLDQMIQTFKGVVSTNGCNNDKVANACNNDLAILGGIQPQDEIEGMSAIQMIGVHNMAMDTIGRAMLGGQTFEGKQTNINQATKMLRTFMIQMETLKKYRTGNQQKMVVGQVNVSEGGQAVVGTVNQGRDAARSQSWPMNATLAG